jgi:ribosomal protein S18 acetylase RimI-like enzyme
MSDYYIRPYAPEDQPGIEWLYARTPPAGRTYVRPQPLAPDLGAIDANYDAFWVAVEPTAEGDAIVGMAGLERIAEHQVGAPVPDFIERSRPTANLHHVIVAPERQRRGIGRELMRTATEWARSNAFEAAVLNTTPQQEAAVAFYHALGFSEVGRSMIGRYELIWFHIDL